MSEPILESAPVAPVRPGAAAAAPGSRFEHVVFPAFMPAAAAAAPTVRRRRPPPAPAADAAQDGFLRWLCGRHRLEAWRHRAAVLRRRRAACMSKPVEPAELVAAVASLRGAARGPVGEHS